MAVGWLKQKHSLDIDSDCRSKSMSKGKIGSIKVIVLPIYDSRLVRVRDEWSGDAPCACTSRSYYEYVVMSLLGVKYLR